MLQMHVPMLQSLQNDLFGDICERVNLDLYDQFSFQTDWEDNRIPL